MLSVYTSYICCNCKKEIVLLSENIEMFRGYLVCPYCSSRKIKKQKITDSLKECMQEKAYKRVHGAIRQVTK
ncbi:hypothetical protein FDG46_17285 [Clostridium botulinum]|uniref:hypothetical protein n=1 Tax=Clostridium botulinum TaxID=1491 RepID=UPI0001591F59|nr:hypothetical protein [Clostridium botulinum]ABS35067.1 conserved hypothetical protein [Clostridium botulinum A str. ATCC 19397]MBO3438461.1 hypothetical protein [Clostridium botulinum]NFH87851.1 hypothetical protein [Clostridium botulinum]NFJ77470.1 hypothetical protein [Clostridium botulinum]NFM55088.1 hypothetical protein [Clostridium botulinum]